MVLFQSCEPLSPSPVYSFCNSDTLIRENLREKTPWRIDATVVVSCPPWRCRLCIRACHGHQLTWTRALRDLIEGPLLVIVGISPIPRSITVWTLCLKVSKSSAVFWNVSSLSSEHIYIYLCYHPIYNLYYVSYCLWNIVLCARHHSKCFMLIKTCVKCLLWIILFNPHSNPVKWIPLSFPIYRWGNWGWEVSSGLSPSSHT